MTAPASWLVYDALLDFTYEPESGALRLNPQFAGKFAMLHPLWWGTGETQDGKTTVRFERVFSVKPLAVKVVEVQNPDRSYRLVELPQPVEIKVDAVVNW